MNLIQQAVAHADRTDRSSKPVFTPLEPIPNLGSIHSTRSFRPVRLNPSRTPLLAIALALLALGGGAALYVALAHSRDEAAAVTAMLSQIGSDAAPDTKTPSAPPTAAAPAAAVLAPEPVVQAAAAKAPPAATPAPAPAAAPAATSADLLLEARYTIDAWARAWSQRDVPAYLAYYGAGFAPERGVPREAWEKARRLAIERRNSILVTISNLHLEAVAPDRIVARYTQDYAADAYRETGTPKRLVLAREGAVWRIVAEADVTGATR